MASRFLFLLLVLVCFWVTSQGQTRQFLQGDCAQGNHVVVTDGRNSTTKVRRSFPACTVTVFDAGTMNLSAIASDEVGTPKPNPFTADSTGHWSFWATQARYDVRISGSGLASPFTFPNMWVVVPSAAAGDVVGPGASTDNAVVRFDGTTGKLIQNSNVTLSDLGSFAFVDDVRQTFNPGANNSGLNVGSSTADPSSPQDGDMYYNSSLGSFRCRVASVWQNCLGTGNVTGPGSSTDNAIVRWDGATGQLIQNSTVIVGDTGNVTGLGTLNTHTLPGGTDTIALIAASQTFSNKTLNNTNSFSGYYDISRIGAPANPGAGLMRIFANDSTGFLSCLTSAGANCMPSGGGGGTPGGSSGNIQWNSAGSFAGITGSVVTSLGEVLLANDPRTAGGAAAGFIVKTSADTTLTADTERIFVIIGGNGSGTVTRQWTAGGGSFTTQREHVIFEPTYAFTSSDTITNAATLAIRNSPQQGTNATITNSYALWIQGGQSLFAGTVLTTASGTQSAIRIGSFTSDPSGAASGDMYYNSTSNVFKGAMSGVYQIVAMTDFSNAWGDGVRQTFNPNNSVAGINVGSNNADPSTPVNGDLFYDGDDNLLRARINGAWVNLGSGGGTPGGASGTIQWNNGGSFAGVAGSVITTLGEVKLNNTARSSGGSVRAFQQITSSDTGLTADTESIFMQFGGTTASPPVTATRQFTQGGGAFGTQREYVFVHPTYAFTSADSINTAATVSITGAPVAGTNATLSFRYALFVESGDVFVTNNVLADSVLITRQVLQGPATLNADESISLLDFRGANYSNIANSERPVYTFDAGGSLEMNFDGGGGAIATQRSFRVLRQGNISSDAAQTITLGATFSVDGPPVAGTNVTITTALAGWFQTGAVRYGTPSSATGSIQFAVSGDADVTTLQAGDAPASAVTYKWPADDPAATQVLTVTSFSGGVAVLEWAAGGGGSGCTPGGSQGDFQINNGAGGCAAGVITQGTNGRVIATPTLTSSGAVSYFRIITPVDTGQTPDAEMPGIVLGGNASSATVTRTGADGTTIALQREVRIINPTYAFAGATTITRAATLSILAAPVAGTNATLTNTRAILVEAGQVELPNGSSSATSIVWNQGNNTGIFSENGNVTSFVAQGSYVAGASGGGGVSAWVLTSTANLLWSNSTSSITGTTDTGLVRHAAGVVRITDGGGTSTPGQLLVGNSGDTIGAQLHVVTQATTVVGLRVDSITNATAALMETILTADDTSTVADHTFDRCRSNGTPATGFGCGWFVNLESDTTNDRLAAGVRVAWQDAADGTRTAYYAISTVGNAGSLFDRLTAYGGTTFTTIVLGNGITTGSPLSSGAFIQGTSGSGTNIAGTTIALVGGTSTGTGVPGQVAIQYTTQSTSSGTGVNAADNGQYLVPSTNFSQTSTVTVANTTTETTVIGTQIGDGVIGAGIFRPGRTITIDLAGFCSVTATPNLTLRFKLGSTTVLTKTFTALPNTANRELRCKVIITGRTFSSTGTVIAQGSCSVVDGLTTEYTATGFETATTTVDLTTDQSITITAQWSAASASNSVSVTNILANINN